MITLPKEKSVDTSKIQPGELIYIIFAFYKFNFHMCIYLYDQFGLYKY